MFGEDPSKTYPADEVEGVAELLERATRLLSIATGITTLHDPAEIPAKVVDSLVRELDLPVASVILLDKATGALKYAAEHGVPPEVKALGFRGGGTTRTVMHSGEAQFVEDADLARQVHPGVRPHFPAYACVPIRHLSHMYGVLFVNFRCHHVFSPVERHILTTFANLMGVALNNAELHQTERRRSEALADLADLGHALSSTLEEETILRIVGRALRNHLPSAQVFVLWVRDGDCLDPRLMSGIKEARLTRTAVSLTTSRVVGACPGSGLVALSASHVFADLGLDHEAAAVLLPEPPLAVAMPLGTAGHLDGFLAVIGPPMAARQFEDADLDFLRALGDRAAGALHNARLYAETLSAASRDGLTGVLNHASFKHCLGDLLRESRHTGQALSLAMLDADHFKRCNDLYGHPFGDRVLVALAQTIQAFVRPMDRVGRWGGEEFVIALPGADADSAYGVCERIRKAVGMLQLPSREGIPIQAPTISLGIATFRGVAQTADELVEAADAALYRAKAQGRNRTCLPA